jgi:hypothetical protein
MLRSPLAGAAAILGVLFILAVSTGALVAPAQAADPIKAQLTVNSSGGYARLVFLFSDDVDSQVKLSNGILVISFKRPVDVSVNRLDTNAIGYVSAARRDPDGSAVRIALSRKVTVNSMMAGERLFVDLLPDTWKGPPPPLPQEVVEDLARRARDAEKKIREQRQLAQLRQTPAVRVHLANQPTFSRYVFQLPDLIAVSTNRDQEKFTLSFEAPLRFDFGEAVASQPPTVQSIESTVEDQTTKVTITLLGKVDVRTFREDNDYIVDLGALDATSKRVDTLLSAKPAPASAERPPGAMKQEAGGPGRSAPPSARTEAAGQPAQPAAPAAETSAAPVASPAPPPPMTPPATIPAVAPTEPSAAATPAAPEPKEASKDASEAVPDAIPGANASEEPPVPGASGAQQPNAPVKIEMRRQSDNIKLTFPFSAPTPAAIFRRADTLWMVFDTDKDLDIGALSMDPTHTIRSVTVGRSEGGQVVLIKLQRPRLTSLAPDGWAWTVTVGDTVLDPTAPLEITRNQSGGPHETATIAFDAPHMLHRLSDPDVGDTLLVITALGPARGFLKTQDFVEFRALASTHGVAIQPFADDLIATLSSDKVILGRPNGLTLSPASVGGKRANRGSSSVFDSQLWGFDRQAPFTARQKELLEAAADAPETKRTAPRLDLARFYLSRDMYEEAKGVLDVTIDDERPTGENTSSIVMRAVADIMLGRPDDGIKDLANPQVGNRDDAKVWRAVAQAEEGKWAEAREAFRGLDNTIATLPIELQRVVLRDAVRASLEVRDFAGAASQLDALETIGVPGDVQPDVAVLTGQLAEGLGRTQEALSSYRVAAESPNRPAAAAGKLREVLLRYQLGELQTPEVTTELETLTTLWRGDDTELEALQVLARLYTEQARYRDAFYVMRTAMQAHPNEEMTRRIQDEAASTFDQLFLAGKADAMPTIDALSLFYDFRELTPIGRRGDEMIRRLADRLVTVDLLDQAATLLQHQVDHRLEGAARSQVATRLAVIYLMDHKPDLTLATLRSTQVTNLSTELRNERLLLEARALSDLGRRDVALEVIANIPGPEAMRLRSDILWSAKRWRESAEQIELLYGDRWRDWQPLNDTERADIMRAAVGYALANDQIGMLRFREKYVAKMSEGPDRRAFDVVSSQLGSNTDEFRTVANAIASVDTLDAFLRDMRARYPETGTLTPTIQTQAPARPPTPQAGPVAPQAGAQSSAASQAGRLAAR